MSYGQEIKNCQHSRLRAALQAGGQKNWPTPAPVMAAPAPQESAGDIKFYLYTGAMALTSLASFLLTSAVTA